MGWRFELKHANIVAYLTTPHANSPRTTISQLRGFLESLQQEGGTSPSLISSDRAWISEISYEARQIMGRWWPPNLPEDSFIPPEVTDEALAPLRFHFGRFDIYGLAVGCMEGANALRAFSEHAAYSSGSHGLFLIPEGHRPNATLEIFDPSPVARKITAYPHLWPGMLFWVRTGDAAFASLPEAEGLYRRLLDALRRERDGVNAVSQILRKFDAQNDASGIRRLLHLSDLHFGTEYASQNQAYLSSHLKRKSKAFHRIIVTGDMFEKPKRRHALAFRNFRSELEAATGKDPIIVPGNHDQKIHGNTFFGFGRDLRELTKLEWSNLVIDDELKCVFYAFDSSREASQFARGRVSREQMIEVATVYETKAVARPDLDQYLSVALIHHHPYSFDRYTGTLLQRGLRKFGLSDEQFLMMEEADGFLKWCTGRRIPLILHGHKHVPRYVKGSIRWSTELREVTAVGCGTSLGAEGMPLSYNVLEWSPNSRNWSVSFFSDPGSGTGFEETYVALHTVS